MISTLRESSSPVGWSKDELDRYINDVYSDTAKETKAVVSTVEIIAAEGQRFIKLPDDTIQVLMLNDKSTGKPIDQVDWLWIDARNRTFARKKNARARYAATFGLGTLMLYPSYSPSGTVVAILVVNPQPLVNDSDIPALPQEFHQSLVYGATHRAMMKDATKERFKRGLEELVRWQASLGGLSTWANRRHEAIRVSNWGKSLRNARSGRW